MAKNTIRKYDTRNQVKVDFEIRKNSDGTFTDVTSLPYDLGLEARSITLVVSNKVASVPIPDNVRYIGVFPKTGTDWRIGLEAPEDEISKTGTALITDFKKGCPVPDNTWSYLILPDGTNRVLYVKSSVESAQIRVSVL